MTFPFLAYASGMVIILASAALNKGAYLIPAVTFLADFESLLELLIIKAYLALVLFDYLVNLGQNNLRGRLEVIFPQLFHEVAQGFKVF